MRMLHLESVTSYQKCDFVNRICFVLEEQFSRSDLKRRRLS